MAVLVTDLQSVLSGLCGGLMTAAGLDGSAASTAWLYPLAESALEMGLILANPLTVVDADFSNIQPTQLPQLVRVAEVRALESALQNFQLVSVTWQLQQTQLDQIGQRLEKAITRKAKDIKDRYGIGVASPSAGSTPSGVSDSDFRAECESW